MIKLSYRSIFDKINRIKKNAQVHQTDYISNYYSFYDRSKEGELYDAMLSDDTILFIVSDIGDINRVFFATYNVEVLSDMLLDVRMSCLIDYNTFQEENPLADVIQKGGFTHYSTYIRRHYDISANNGQYNNKESALLDRFYSDEIVSYACKEDADEIYAILWDVFDPKRDHLPNKDILIKWIEDERVLYYREEGTIYSLYIYEVQGRKMYSAFSYNKTSADKLYCLEKKAFIDAVERDHVTQKYSWVNVKNLRAAGRTDYINENFFNHIYYKEESPYDSMYLDWEFNLDNMIKHVGDRKVVIWGVTIVSTIICDWVRKNKVEVECFVDREYRDYPDKICGLNVKPIDDYLGNKQDYYFWIFTPYRSDIEKKLDDLNMQDMYDYLYMYRCKRFNKEREAPVALIYLDYASKVPELSGTEPYEDKDNNRINGSKYRNVFFIGKNSSIYIGDNVKFGKKTQIIIGDNANLVIGDNTTINGLIIVADESCVEIGQNCEIIKNTSLLCIKHSYIFVADDAYMEKAYVNALDSSRLHIGERCFLKKRSKIYAQLNSEVIIGIRFVLRSKSHVVARKRSNIKIGSSVTFNQKSGTSSQKMCRLTIGDDSKIGEKTSIDALYKSVIEIGEHFSTQTLSLILAKYNSEILVGRCVWTRWNLFMNAGYYSKINIGERTQLARNNLVISGNSHPIFNLGESEGEYKSNATIDIGKNVWVGNNVSIHSGASIGDNCIVAVQSTVNRKFPENCMLMGNPARIIRRDVFKGVADDPEISMSKEIKEVWEKDERQDNENIEKN